MRPHPSPAEDDVQAQAAGEADLRAAAVTARPDHDSLLADSVLAAVVPSMLGLTAYAIVRQAYVWFYEIYGVTPEEVGLDHRSMLTGMLRFLHLWVWSVPGSPAINFVLVLLAAALLVIIWGRLLPRLRRRSKWVDWMATSHPALLGASLVLLLVLLMSSWALPRDRDFAGKRLQLGKHVRPTQLAFLSIHADPVKVAWIGTGQPPAELISATMIYLGKADGIVVLYRPPNWGACPVIDDCRGAVWRVREEDVALRFEINPPDRHAPGALGRPAASHS